MTLFKNRYRIESTRLQNWDYRWNGAYFITICTHNGVHRFGQVENGKMNVSIIGAIADIFWYEIKNHTTNVELGEFVVMPNHIHGILILNNFDGKSTDAVETLHATSLHVTDNDKNEKMSSISPKPNSISTIIRSYKSAVTKHVRRLGYDFKWQCRFHDHIIRNEKSYHKITEYIRMNPMQWDDDCYNSNNMK